MTVLSTITGTDTPAEQHVSLVRTVGRSYFPIAFSARLPFAMMVVGVLTFVSSARDSLSIAGLTSAFVGIGTVTVGPLIGIAADRLGQRKVLLVITALHTVAIVTLALIVLSDLPTGFLLGSAFFVGATAPQVSPLSRSRLIGIIAVKLPQDRRAKTTNSTLAYESAADEVVFIFGPILVGLLASLVDPMAPILVAAGLTAIFVAAFALHDTARFKEHDESLGLGEPAPVRAAFTAPLLMTYLGIFGIGLFFGSALTSLTSFMKDLGRASEEGLYYGAMGVTSAILALSVAFFSARFTLAARWLSFAAVMFAGSYWMAQADSAVAMLLALAIAGIGVGPTLVTAYGLATKHTPVGRRATVMTIAGAAVIAGQSLATAVVGSLAEDGHSVTPWTPLVAASVIVIAAAIYALRYRNTTESIPLG